MRPSAKSLYALLAAAGLAAAAPSPSPGQRRLYVASPGIRNYVEWGGKGILVYDIDRDHALLKRIASPFDDPGGKVENIKGVCAHAASRRLYVTSLTRLACIDLVTDTPLWVKALEGGCDRLSVTPDGRALYVPSLEGPHWNVVDPATGDIGERIGPFGAPVRPFTVNAAGSRCFVNVNGLLGFEVGDVVTGKVLARVEVPGFKQGNLKRHGCPSHGVGLTPDEKELWVVDGANQRVHVFDATTVPPAYLASIALDVDQPGWITFTIDGAYAYPSTGEVIDTKTRKIVAQLKDEQGRPVQSEKLLEIDFAGDVPVRAGDQFGVGRAGRDLTSPATTRP